MSKEAATDKKRKITSSFHLEQDTIEEIVEYKRFHNLSSRNIALEHMLVERRSILKLVNALQNMLAMSNPDLVSDILGIKTTTRNEVKKEEPKKEEPPDPISMSIYDTFNSMPD